MVEFGGGKNELKSTVKVDSREGLKQKIPQNGGFSLFNKVGVAVRKYPLQLIDLQVLTNSPSNNAPNNAPLF